MNAVSGSRWRERGDERQKTRGKVRQTETETERESGGQAFVDTWEWYAVSHVGAYFYDCTAHVAIQCSF